MRMRLLVLVLILALFALQPINAQDAPPPGEILYSSSRNGQVDLYIINTDGTNERRLTTDTGRDVMPAWDPTGSVVVFTRRGDNQALVALEVDTGIEREITVMSLFTPSPNRFSKFITFLYSSQIHTMHIDGEGLTQLTFEGSFNYVPAWSRDGERIAYVAQDSSTFSTTREETIYVMNADGSDQREVYTAVGDVNGLEWSPDNRSIAFNLLTDNGAAVYVVDTETGEATQVTDDTAYYGLAPTWSPDGEWIAFQRHELEDGSPQITCGANTDNDRLYIIRPNGEDLQQINDVNTCYPTWRPSGE